MIGIADIKNLKDGDHIECIFSLFHLTPVGTIIVISGNASIREVRALYLSGDLFEITNEV